MLHGHDGRFAVGLEDDVRSAHVLQVLLGALNGPLIAQALADHDMAHDMAGRLILADQHLQLLVTRDVEGLIIQRDYGESRLVLLMACVSVVRILLALGLHADWAPIAIRNVGKVVLFDGLC